MAELGANSHKQKSELPVGNEITVQVASAKLADDYHNTVQWKGTQFGPDTLKDIKEHRVSSLDYSNAWASNSKAILFGESHIDFSAKCETAKAIPALKQLGATHLCLEMLAQKDQALIDTYMDGKCSREKIKHLLASQWGWNGLRGAESYMKVIDAAKAAGIKVVGLDLTSAQQKQQIAAGTKITFENTLQSKYLPMFFSPIRHESIPSETEVREKAWTDKIASIAEIDKSAKFIVYAGAAHNSIHTDKGMPHRLADRLHTNPLTIVFEGGERDNPLNHMERMFAMLSYKEPVRRRPYFDSKVEEAKLEQQRFAIKFDSKHPAFIQHNPESGYQETIWTESSDSRTPFGGLAGGL